MFDELKNSWKKQEAQNLPSVEGMLTEVRKERSKLAARLLVASFSIALAVLVLFLIWYYIPFKYTTTKVSILVMGSIMTCAVGYMLYLRNRIPGGAEATRTSKEYVDIWISYKENMKSSSKSFMVFYFAIITVGMIVYLYEIFEGDIVFMILACGGVLAWMAFVWFYWKPKLERQTDQKIQSIIDNYKSIAAQLED